MVAKHNQSQGAKGPKKSRAISAVAQDDRCQAWPHRQEKSKVEEKGGVMTRPGLSAWTAEQAWLINADRHGK